MISKTYVKIFRSFRHLAASSRHACQKAMEAEEQKEVSQLFRRQLCFGERFPLRSTTCCFVCGMLPFA